MAERTLAQMIQPQVTEQDATLVDVFGLKSKPADDYFEQLASIVGSIGTQPEPLISEQELMDIAIG